MKICAIICEYNPLHYGHLYHIQKAKELSGCDAVMCIQAGNFTQRGEPAITNKYANFFILCCDIDFLHVRTVRTLCKFTNNQSKSCIPAADITYL